MRNDLGDFGTGFMKFRSRSARPPREKEREHRSPARSLTRRTQLAAVGFGDGTTDGQADPGAAALPVPCRVGPVEPLEDVRQVL